ncbi:hypothetical protein PHLGIDRAFT_124522 [Phlebiopsis gigantea 11061_1 CR5-6]|uniref:MYND-type domain-containing protein n=1 Tax=Phlebiopsis gigantea (strain 11061_1 CR5-6) TaxID=745531 RepID=A0A0C3P1Y7_PHLG1|nr:hypothetical protein PHLGIDRAFT_124522 [Phlebiopsis gigantea 11061_1 CR5-6]
MSLSPTICSIEPDTTAFPKQCQHCYIAESTTTKLKCCGRCKRAHYCSKECQNADWKAHKGKCQYNVQKKAEIRADGWRQIRIAEGHSLDLRSLLAGMKTWSRFHRDYLTWAAIHALRLKDDNLNCMKFALHIIIVPSGKQPPHHMKLEDAFAVPLAEVIDTLREKGNIAMIEQLEAVLEQSRAIRKEGRLGFVIALIQSGSVMNAAPLGLADRINPEDHYLDYDPRWLDKLRAAVQGELRHT